MTRPGRGIIESAKGGPSRRLWACLLVLAGVILWIGWQWGRGRDLAPTDLVVPSEARPNDAGLSLSESAGRRAAAAQQPVAGTSQEERQLLTSRILSGKVQSEDGSPVKGALVSLGVSPLADAAGLLVELREAKDKKSQAITLADGTFAFQARDLLNCDLMVVADGYAAARKTNCYPGIFQVITVTRGRVVRGIVRYGDTLEPAAGIAVRGTFWGQGHRMAFSVLSNSDGEFETQPLELDSLRIEARSVFGWSRRPAIVLPQSQAGAVETIAILLERGIEVRGRVVELQSGLPVEGVEISDTWTFTHYVRTNALGEYTYPSYIMGSTKGMHARRDGYGRAEALVSRSPAEDQMRADFVLAVGRVAKGRCVDSTGGPIVGADVWGLSAEKSDRNRSITDSDGQFLLVDLRRDVTHTLLIRTPSQGQVAYAFPSEELTSDVVEFGEIAISPGCLLSGQVSAGQGYQLGRVTVSLDGTNSDRWRYTKSGLTPGYGKTWSIDRTVAQRSVRLDTTGSYVFANVAAGSYRIRLMDGQRSLVEHEVVIRVGATHCARDLALPEIQSVSGRVVDESSAGVAGALVTMFVGDSAGVEGLTDATGRFLFHPPDGTTAQFKVLPPRDSAQGELRYAPLHVFGVPLGRRDVVLMVSPASVIAGRVSTQRDLSMYPTLYVVAVDAEGHAVATKAIPGPGEFELTVSKGRTYDLEVWPEYRETQAAMASNALLVDTEEYHAFARVERIAAGSRNIEVVIK
jgi:hypothetical protein